MCACMDVSIFSHGLQKCQETKIEVPFRWRYTEKVLVLHVYLRCRYLESENCRCNFLKQIHNDRYPMRPDTQPSSILRNIGFEVTTASSSTLIGDLVQLRSTGKHQPGECVASPFTEH